MAAQYSFVMKGMTKTFPGASKPVLSNINLQFYPDAKIGIVGPNGTGKSTLMKIMAGMDTEFTGEAWPGEHIRVGYLAQEPELDPTRPCAKTLWMVSVQLLIWWIASTRFR